MTQEDFARVTRDSPIAGEIRGQKHSIRAETFRSNRWHRRTHPKPSCFVRGGADNGATTTPCDDDRLTPQLGIVALLHGCIKRVHVHVYDFPSRHPILFYSLTACEGGRLSSQEKLDSARSCRHLQSDDGQIPHNLESHSMTAADFRRIALSVEEYCHAGLPGFRVGGRKFASLASQAGGYGNLMLALEQQAAFVEERPRFSCRFLGVGERWDIRIFTWRRARMY